MDFRSERNLPEEIQPATAQKDHTHSCISRVCLLCRLHSGKPEGLTAYYYLESLTFSTVHQNKAARYGRRSLGNRRPFLIPGDEFPSYMPQSTMICGLAAQRVYPLRC